MIEWPMRLNNLRIFQLFSLLQSCLLLPLPVLAQEEHSYRLVEQYYVAETSNKADVDLFFEQAGTQEGFRLEFYNSNPDSPVLVLQLTENEDISSHLPSISASEKMSTFWVSVNKKVTFHPAALSGTKANPPLTFNFINPPQYAIKQHGDQPNAQQQVRYRVSATWNDNALILTFQQNWEKAQKLDVTEWAKKRGITLTYTPLISRIDIFANHNNSVVFADNDYQLTESLGLNFPLWQQLFGEAQKVLDTPEVFWYPSSKNIEDAIIDTCKKIATENAHLLYMLTPFADQDDSEDARKIATMVNWKTTSTKQDAIYIEAMKCAQHRFYSREAVITLDDKLSEIIWPHARKIIFRRIYLHPKNSSLGKHWVITSKMTWDTKVSNIICEVNAGQKSCRLFAALPITLENRLAFITRDKTGNVKAWLGANEYEQISLTDKFPDIAQVEEFEISQEFEEF